MEEIKRQCEYAVIEEMPEDDILSPLCSQFEKPVKSDAIKSHRSRFSLMCYIIIIKFVLNAIMVHETDYDAIMHNNIISNIRNKKEKKTRTNVTAYVKTRHIEITRNYDYTRF